MASSSNESPEASDGQNARDQLCLAAECYENTLSLEKPSPESFAADNPGLARTLRMLTTVFESTSRSTQRATEQVLTHIGRFVVEKRLGHGGFGTVWLARDPTLNRNVAIKLAHVGAHASNHLLERFNREAQLAARLHHPNLIPTFESGRDNDRLFIVSEYCSGVTLAQWLKHNNGIMPHADAAQLIRSLADGIDHAHQLGLIHRDIKPGNILLDESLNSSGVALVPKLTDFGLARDLTSNTSSTKSGMVVGSVKYMSPEQATGRTDLHGPASDVYSLGVVLYQLLSGSVPFAGNSDFAVIQRVISEQPRSVPGDAPRDLTSICMKCIRKTPANRYTNAGELRDDLDRYMRGDTTVARPIGPLERLKRWGYRSPSTAAFVGLAFLMLSLTVAALNYHLNLVQQNADQLNSTLQKVRDEQASSRIARRDAEVARGAAESHAKEALRIGYLSAMRLAFQLHEQGRYVAAIQILERYNADELAKLRGPEWHVLWNETTARHCVLGQHNGAATECVLTAEPGMALTAGTDGYVRKWNLRTRLPGETYTPGIGEIHALAVSPNGKQLAVGGGDINSPIRRVRILDLTTGDTESDHQLHSSTIESIEYSPDGRWLAAGSRYSSVQLTRLKDGRTFTLPAERRHRSLAFSFDSQWLAIAATHEETELWPVGDDEPGKPQKVPGYQGGSPRLVQFQPGQNVLATAYNNHRYVSIFEQPQNNKTGILFQQLKDRGTATYQSMRFSRDAAALAAGNDSGSVVVWNLNDPISVTKVSPHRSPVCSLQLVDRTSTLSTDQDGNVCLTSVESCGYKHQRWTGIAVTACAQIGGELILGGRDGRIRRIAAGYFSQSPQAKFHSQNSPPTNIDASCFEVVAVAPSAIHCLAISETQDTIAVGCADGEVMLLSSDTGETIHESTAGGELSQRGILAIDFSSDGQYLAFTGENGYIKVIDTTTYQQRLHFPCENGRALRFFSNDQLLAVANASGVCRTFDIASGSQLSTEASHVDTLDVSPNGRFLISGLDEGGIRISDTSSHETKTIRRHQWAIQSVDFAPNGTSFASLDMKGHLSISDLGTGTSFGQIRLGPPKLDKEFTPAQVVVSNSWLAAIAVHTDSRPAVTDVYYWRWRDEVEP